MSEEQLECTVKVRDGKIVVEFSKPVNWISLDLEASLSLKAALEQRIAELKGRLLF